MRKYNYCVSRVMKNKSVSLYLLATSGFQVFMDEIHGVAIIIHICFSFLSAHIVHFILNLLFFVIISASMVIYMVFADILCQGLSGQSGKESSKGQIERRFVHVALRSTQFGK